MKKVKIEMSKEINVYTFDELKGASREKAIDIISKEILDIRSDETGALKESWLEYLNDIFPNSDLEVQFSLGYCQGDGVNIYGDLNLFDVSDYLEKKGKVSDKITEYIKLIKQENIHIDINTTRNDRYSYCKAHELKGDIIEELSYQLITWVGILEAEIDYKELEKFERDVITMLEDLCIEFEKDGYKYFYECDEDEIEYYINDMEYMFLENGSIYNSCDFIGDRTNLQEIDVNINVIDVA